MTLSRRSRLRRTAGGVATLLFADIFKVIPIRKALGATYQVAPPYRPENDGWSHCRCTNCVHASAAMLRSTITEDGCNNSGAWWRLRYNIHKWSLTCGPSSVHYCGASTGSCSTMWCPDAGLVDTDMGWVRDALQDNADGCGVDSIDWESSGCATSFFFSRLCSSGTYCGWSAIVFGRNSYGKPCPNGYSGDHAVYVPKGNSDGSQYYVYDPNAPSCSPMWWTQSQLQQFAWHWENRTSQLIYCILGRAV
ncbi:MAG: hypothetical protein ACP5VP_11550 [Candidatus Limnocylindrales bacterium]